MAKDFGYNLDTMQFQMPEWMTGGSMSYQSPSLASDIRPNGTPNYLYRQSFGGYGLNEAMPTNTNGSWWSNATGLEKMSAIGQGVQAFATLANLYSGFKGLQMQKDQFKFMKGAWNKNFSAQLAAYDNTLRDNYRKMAQGAAHFGNPVPTEEEYMQQRSLSYLGT